MRFRLVWTATAAAPASSGRRLFCPGFHHQNQPTQRHFQGRGDLHHILDADISLAAFNAADVGPVNAANEGQFLLREAQVTAEFLHRVAECGLGVFLSIAFHSMRLWEHCLKIDALKVARI
jgi:hypothetical protein